MSCGNKLKSLNQSCYSPVDWKPEITISSTRPTTGRMALVQSIEKHTDSGSKSNYRVPCHASTRTTCNGNWPVCLLVSPSKATAPSSCSTRSTNACTSSASEQHSRCFLYIQSVFRFFISVHLSIPHLSYIIPEDAIGKERRGTNERPSCVWTCPQSSSSSSSFVPLCGGLWYCIICRLYYLDTSAQADRESFDAGILRNIRVMTVIDYTAMRY